MATRPATYIPTDPLFGLQWHLRNTGQVEGAVPGQDLNVIQVWPDYTGNNVIVAVFDDGFDQTHPDWGGNYLIEPSWDFDQNKQGADALSDDNHGTAVAGLIAAAANNGIGGVGVAWAADVIGYRGLTDIDLLARYFQDASTRMIAAGADITCNSWGPMQSPFDSAAFQPSYLATATQLATEGRGGLGIITVFAAGNDRELNLNVNYEPLFNPYVIGVAASKSDGFITSYSTAGASVLVTAPGSDPASIVTMDRQGSAGYNNLLSEDGNYTNRNDSFFNGTSAAAHIAAGVTALMLEANPNLGYRDVQEILVQSSRRAMFIEADGVQSIVNQAINWNGGGLMTGDDFGFGNIDAHAAVRLAESWQKKSTTANLALIDGKVETETLLVNAGEVGQARASFIEQNRLEHITVSIDLQADRLQEITLELVSPGGTRSTLIDRPPIIEEIELPKQLVYTLSSVRFWGESLAGDWALRVTNSADGSPLNINDWSIKAYASDLVVPTVQFFTDEFAAFAARDESRSRIDSVNGVYLNASAVTADSVFDFSGRISQIGGVEVSLVEPHAFQRIFAGDGDDRLIGNSLDNQIMGGRGSNVIDGGAGLDTALYIGSRSFYGIELTNRGYEIRSNTLSGGGVDTLLNIERLQFTNGVLALDLSGTAGQAYRLYQAAFDRTPDTPGLKYQTNALDTGLSLWQVAGNFIASPEFQGMYGSPATVTDAQFVTLLYNNVLDRNPEQAGYDYHINNLAGGLTRAQLLTQFSESPENQRNVFPAIQDGIWMG